MTKYSSKQSANKLLDPLYMLFEKHLYTFQDAEIDRKTFVTQVVQDYMTYLRKNNLTIPKIMEKSVMEEFCEQVNHMLLKKIYGFVDIKEFRTKECDFEKKKSHEKSAKS